MQELILEGKIVVGMNTHMVFYALGRPDQVKEINESDGNSEMWVYEKGGSKRQYLHFNDGILTNIKD
jgi:hypothetical protein